MSRPTPVRIDDLAAPRFPAEIEPMIAGLSELASQITLEPEALMAMAVSQTGLDDFGDGAFHERLEVLCRALRTEARPAPIGMITQGGLLIQLLKSRLLIEDLIRRHPEIEALEIARPIIVCGLPRTGTTHLHNLMSADPALRSLPYWEALEPVLPDAERPRPGEPDPRIARCELALDLTNGAMPYFKRMHEMTIDHVHEEIQLLALDFSSMLFETTAPMPTWRDYYRSHDQSGPYAYMKRVLKVLQWLRGGERWLLKSPQHIEQFPVLQRTFPDATFVITHRDPVAVVASVCTMLTYTARMCQANPDPRAIAAYWSERFEVMLRACVRDRDGLPEAQTIDVAFDEFMADDVAAVSRIYDVAGQPMTPAVRAAMERFMADHPRGRHGGVIYDLEELGLDGDRLRESLRFYAEHFTVSAEESPARA